MSQSPNESADLLASDIMSPLGRAVRALHRPAARLVSLEGKTIGLLDNSKRNASLVLDEIGLSLLKHGVRQVVYRRKASAAMPGGPLLEQLAETCDAVVNAHGDCGSCTSWCVHDSVELERRGIPVATINTSEFAALGRFEAIALGMPSLAIVTIAHPIGSLSEAIARERGRTAVPGVTEALTNGTSEPWVALGGIAVAPRSDLVAADCGCAV
jgi:hypothetical protein